MGEFIRKLIRWIIFIILVVLLILLIIKLVNSNGSAKKTKKAVDTSVETIKKNTITKEKDKENNKTTSEEIENEEINMTLEVETPNTSSNGYLYILGILVLNSGIYYIYKNREIKD